MKKQIWFTSDTHYNHKNRCRGVSTWANKETTTRDFETLEQMNNEIVERINKFVDQDDILYHLGDWSFGGIESIWQFRQRIICKNVHLITGNHDDHIKKNKPRETKWIRWYNGPIDQWYEWKDNFKTEKECLEACSKESFYEPHQYNFNYPQDLFTSINNYLELELDGQTFVLSHYPIDEWFDMDRKGAIMLHGHVHHTFDECETNTKYRRMDVGIDWKEFRPYSLEEIVRIMNNRKRKQHSS